MEILPFFGGRKHLQTSSNALLLGLCFCCCCLPNIFAQEQANKTLLDRLRIQGGINFLAADSSMSMTLRFRMQNQVSLETASAQDLSVRDVQFVLRRARVRMLGFVVDPRLTYSLQLGFSRNDVDFDNSGFVNVLRDAMVTYRALPNFTIGFGLSKLPGNRERVVTSGELQFIDRSLLNTTFTLDRDVGFQAAYTQALGTNSSDTSNNPPLLIVRLALSTGEGRNPIRTVQGLLSTARFEFMPFGAFTDNGDMTTDDIQFEQTPKLFCAGIISHNANATRVGGTLGLPLFAQRTMDTYFFDALFKYRGFSLFAEYARRTAPDPVTREGTSIRSVFTGEGLNVQAGYFLVPKQWCLSLRYTSIEPEQAVARYVNGQTQYTVCVGYLVNGHRVKLQTDLTYNVRRDVQLGEQRSWILRGQVELGL